MFGNLYFSDKSICRYFYTNDIQNTLVENRILRSDSTIERSSELQKIRNYLFERKASGRWLNTYETSKIIETILPELVGKDKELSSPKLSLTGSVNKVIEEFPYELEVSSSDSIQVMKTGDFPVYLTAYSHYWNPAPKEKISDFEISTSFGNEGRNILKAGESVKMIVRLKVFKDADYVMINAPIPAGCSYGDKSGNSYHEVHREYFRNETAIFCEKLKIGDYEFVINLVPRYNGKYTLNPAKVEMMYFPTFNANNEIRKVIIE